jgi:hypothetical protein
VPACWLSELDSAAARTTLIPALVQYPMGKIETTIAAMASYARQTNASFSFLKIAEACEDSNRP